MNQDKQPDIVGNILIISLFLTLLIAAIYSYKSIDWQVLKRMEDQPLILPSPATSSGTP